MNVTSGQESGNWLIRGIVVGIGFLVVTVLVVWEFIGWFDSISAGGTLTADRITSASNAVIQLDSFLVAGFIVGFFYLWERMESLTKRSSGEPLVIALSFLTIISFAVSGLFAVGAILTVQPWYLRGACVFLVGGISSILSNWYALQVMLGLMKNKGVRTKTDFPKVL